MNTLAWIVLACYPPVFAAIAYVSYWTTKRYQP